MTLYPRLHCPQCAGALVRQPLKLHTGHKLLIGFMDVPFWLVFAVGVAVGLSNPWAGALSAVVLALGFWMWVRIRSNYRCSPCDKSFRYAEAVK